MVKIYVDADACPVKDEILRVVARHKLKVHFVANNWMRLPQSELIEQTVVPSGPDVADDLIADLISPSDICITGDIPLAKRCVDKGAIALSASGQVFDSETVQSILATRDLMTYLRDNGLIEGGGGKAFSPAQRSNFLNVLEKMVRQRL